MAPPTTATSTTGLLPQRVKVGLRHQPVAVMQQIASVLRAGACQQAAVAVLADSLTSTAPLVAPAATQAAAHRSATGKPAVRSRVPSPAPGAAASTSRVRAAPGGRVRPSRRVPISRSARASMLAMSTPATATVASTGVGFAVS